MASKLPLPNIPPKIVTDLDQSDEPRPPSLSGNQKKTISASNRKSHHRHRNNNKKEIKNLSGNFVSRSRSADNRGGIQQGDKDHDIEYLKMLIRTKDDQIEKLVTKISELHNYNNQFAQENNRLRIESLNANENFQLLSKQLDEIKLAKCPICTQWEEEKKDIISSNKLLRDDVTMLKTLVYRLNVQLERYQDKLRKCATPELELEALENPIVGRFYTDSPIPPSQAGDCGGSINWGPVNTHTLGPLLNAYEEMIKEKDDLILQHEREINRFTGRLNEIIEENEHIHQEIDDLRKAKENWHEERTRIQAQLEICRQKAEVQTKRADLAKEKLVEVLRCYEQKVQAQTLDLERLQDAYTRAKSELISLKNVHTSPQTEAVVDSLKECQRLFEELKSQHCNEKVKLTAELSECRKQLVDLEEKLSQVRNENSTLKVLNEKQMEMCQELQNKIINLKQHSRRIKESRDRLKSRLRIALQWAQKLEDTRDKVTSTWDQLRDLEALVRTKEAQIRGLQARHLQEIDKFQKRLEQREETIKNILKEKAKTT